MLVHGLGSSHAAWLAVAPALALRGRVVAIDLPGFGRSARSASGTSLHVMGQALARFIDAISAEPVHLVGNSMGGTLCILEAQARPERIASTLLVGPGLPAQRGAYVDPRWMRTLLIACAPWGHVLLRRHAVEIGPEAQVRELLALCFVDESRAPRDVLEAHFALARERVSMSWVDHAFAQAARSLMGHLLFGRQLRSALREPGPPMHIVHGQGDRLVDVMLSRAAARANPSIELTELPDLGHTPQLEAPEVFLEVAARWLERVGSMPAASHATAATG